MFVRAGFECVHVDVCILLCVLCDLIRRNAHSGFFFLGYSACVHEFARDFGLCAVQGGSGHLEMSRSEFACGQDIG
jgi:hypothetical protein